MAIIFEPGKSYFWLTAEQYELLEDFMEADEVEFDLLSDFVLGEDGNFYAESGNISDAEKDFLVYWDISNFFNYEKSTQSTFPR